MQSLSHNNNKREEILLCTAIQKRACIHTHTHTYTYENRTSKRIAANRDITCTLFSGLDATHSGKYTHEPRKKRVACGIYIEPKFNHMNELMKLKKLSIFIMAHSIHHIIDIICTICTSWMDFFSFCMYIFAKIRKKYMQLKLVSLPRQSFIFFSSFAWHSQRILYTFLRKKKAAEDTHNHLLNWIELQLWIQKGRKFS